MQINIDRLKKYSFLHFAVVFLVGVSLTQAVFITVLAHGGNTNFVHSCIKSSNGSLRIINENETCDTNEIALDWSRNGVGEFGGFISNQLIGYHSGNGSGDTFDYRLFDGANFSQSEFFQNSVRSASFVGANFENTGFIESGLDGTNFTGANFTGAQFSSGVSVSNTNFTDANFTDANLSGQDFSVSIRNGITWSNTICPDGQNSDSVGGTCEGHLTP